MIEETREKIKAHFGDRLVPFDKSVPLPLVGFENEKELLFEIGVPSFDGYGGEYIRLNNLSKTKEEQLKFSTRKHQEQTYFRYLDLKNKYIYAENSINRNSVQIFINTSLESYLLYIVEYEKFKENIVMPQSLGPYWDTDTEEGKHELYAQELKKKFLEINDDVLESEVWGLLIEEMELGVI